MTIKSKFDSKCKDCGTEHRVGDMIDQNNNGTWCKNGKNCQGATNLPSVSATPAPKKDPEPEAYLELARKILNQNMPEEDIQGTIKAIEKETDLKIADVMIRRSLIEKRMNEVGLHHPSRIAFVRDVLG